MASSIDQIKSGFRTPEGAAFKHRSYFFHRFIERYPLAIEELRELLPQFQLVFGAPVEFKDRNDLMAIQHFDSYFLLSKEELLPHVCALETHYHSLRYWRDHKVPEYIAMPNNHEYKCNEWVYRRSLESAIAGSLGKLRAESGESSLDDLLGSQMQYADSLEEEAKSRLTKIVKEKGLDPDDFRIGVEAIDVTRTWLEQEAFFENEAIDKLLADYWLFYEQFHLWLEKYCLQKDWLRRSFFIALRRGLVHFWPDIGYVVTLPKELQDEFYGPEKMYALPSGIHTPSPKTFRFNLTTSYSDKAASNSTEMKWNADCYWFFYSPEEFVNKCVGEFEVHLNQYPLFETEGDLMRAFQVFLQKEKKPMSEVERSKAEAEFRSHIRRFSLFEELADERLELISLFEQHIKEYLDSILPKIRKYYKTTTGRPPNLARIEWLLSWNLDGLTEKEIANKFCLNEGITDEIREELNLTPHMSKSFLAKLRLGDVSTFYAAKRAMEKYDLPVLKKRNPKAVWRLKSLYGF